MLKLKIKKRWFDMILSGEKKEEYRDEKPYYSIRIGNALGESPTILMLLLRAGKWVPITVTFENGYQKLAPCFTALCRVGIGIGMPELGAEPDKEYIVFKIEEILHRERC